MKWPVVCGRAQDLLEPVKQSQWRRSVTSSVGLCWCSTVTKRLTSRYHLMPCAGCSVSVCWVILLLLDELNNCTHTSLSPPVDIIWAMMIVWRIRGKLSELFCAVLCTTVVHSDNAHTYEQFLKMSVALGLGLVFVHLFMFGILCFLGLAWTICSCVVCCCCVTFSFFSATPRDWLGRTSLKWPILCRVGCKTSTPSIKHTHTLSVVV